MATRLAGAVHRADLRCLCILFVAFLSALPNKATAEISAQRYVLKGEMSYSFLRDGKEEHTEKRTCEISRNWDKLKISTSLYNSNHPTTTFVCDSNSSFTYVQHADASVQKSKRGWNNATVWPSTYRMPKYILGELTPLWLMVQGNEEFLNGKDRPWITVFGNGNFNFDRQPKTIPTTSYEGFWPMGFTHYSEIIEIQYSTNSGKIFTQESEFRIQSWTNRSGINFPQSFVSTIKRAQKGNPKSKFSSEKRFSFETTGIEDAAKTSFDTNAPTFSRVIDMRPRELGQSSDGVLYKSPEGIIYSDPLKEKEKGLDLRIAKGDAKPAVATPQHNLLKPKSFNPLIIISSLALLILLLVVWFLKSAKKS